MNIDACERTGRLTVVGPAGLVSSRVRILHEILWWYLIEAMTMTRLSGRDRYLLPGRRAFVPKWAIHSIRAAGIDRTSSSSTLRSYGHEVGRLGRAV
jgi:hypothetical protein